jgi:hypothetical protein
MEIKTLQELVPYHKSLQELWAKEEFQPVLAFLRGLHQEAVNEIQTFKLTEPAEDVKCDAGVLKTKLQFCALFYNLPSNIKVEIDKTLNIEQMKAKIGKSQEGGSI